MTALSDFFSGKRSKPDHEVDLGLSLDNDRVYAHQEDLDKVLPSRLKAFRPDIPGARFDAHICPAQLEDDSWVVLVTPEYKHADVVEELQAEVRRIGKIKENPPVYCVNTSLLLTVRAHSMASGERAKSVEETTIHKATFQEIMAWGIRNNASDVHFNVDLNEASSQISFHINSIYVAPERWLMQTDRMVEILQVAWQSGEGGASPIFNAKSEGQCRVNTVVDSMPIMGRWATMAADNGPSVTLRLLKTDAETVSKTFEEHGYLPSHVAMLERAQNAEGGAIVFSGVVGSGKSTSLASLIDGIPNTRKKGSLEDPVEYRMNNVLQNTVSRNLEGKDDDAFHSKLMMFKRGAYQDIMFGEVRDRQGGLAIMEMIGMGTNCYTSIHARSVMQIPERLSSENIGIPLDFLSSPGNLTLMAFQALLPKNCPNCAMPINELYTMGGRDLRGRDQTGEYWKRYVDRIQRIYDVDTSKVTVRNHEGCEVCRHAEVPELNGFHGRTVIAEMLEPNTDRKYLRLIKQNDFLGAQEHLENLDRARMDAPDMTNKSIMECGVYKMLQGTFDPRIVEYRTTAFETIELIKKQAGSRV